MRPHTIGLVILSGLLSFILTACGPSVPQPLTMPAVTIAPTAEPAATHRPVPQPTSGSRSPKPVTTDTPQRFITLEPARLSLPAISRLPGRLMYQLVDYTLDPDSRRGARGIWIIEHGQPPQLLLAGAEAPILSHAGNSLVFSLRPDIEVTRSWAARIVCAAPAGPCQMNPDRLLLGGNAIGITWSPDDTHVAFTTGGNSGKIWMGGDLRVADINAGTVITALAKGAGYPTFSPDGHWVVMSMPDLGYYHGLLSLARIDGSAYRVLWNFPGIPMPLHVRWRPNGDLSVSMLDNSQPENSQQLLIPMERGSIVQGRYPDVPHEYILSPDGQRVIYRAADSAGWLHVANADGSESLPIPGTDQNSMAVAWSPDSQHLLICPTLSDHFDCQQDRLVQFRTADRQPMSDLVPLPEDYRFRVWLDSDSYLATSVVYEPDLPYFTEVRRVWLDGRTEFLLSLPLNDLYTLQYRP